MALLGVKSREALREFEAHPLVERVRVRWDRISVWYGTGVHECWGLDHGRPRRLMFPRVGWWQYTPEFLPEHTDLAALVHTEPDGDDPMWSVPWDEIRKTGFLDRRLLVQRMVARLLREEWVDPTTPEMWLDWDLDRLRRVATDRHVVTAGYLRQQVSRSHRPPPGFYVAMALNGWGDHQEDGRIPLREAFKDVRRLYWGVEGCISRRRDVHRVALVHAMTSGRAQGSPRRAGPRYIPPEFHLTVLRGICGLNKPVVVDGSRCPGFVAAATVADGGVYMMPPAWSVRPAAPAFASRHLAALVPDDGATADVGLLGDMRASTLEEVEKRFDALHERCATVISMVDRNVGVALRERWRQADVLRFHRWNFCKADEALLVRHQSDG